MRRRKPTSHIRKVTKHYGRIKNLLGKLVRLIDYWTRDVKLIIIGGLWMLVMLIRFIQTRDELYLGIGILIWQTLDMLDGKIKRHKRRKHREAKHGTVGLDKSDKLCPAGGCI